MRVDIDSMLDQCPDSCEFLNIDHDVVETMDGCVTVCVWCDHMEVCKLRSADE